MPPHASFIWLSWDSKAKLFIFLWIEYDLKYNLIRVCPIVQCNKNFDDHLTSSKDISPITPKLSLGHDPNWWKGKGLAVAIFWVNTQSQPSCQCLIKSSISNWQVWVTWTRTSVMNTTSAHPKILTTLGNFILGLLLPQLPVTQLASYKPQYYAYIEPALLGLLAFKGGQARDW